MTGLNHSCKNVQVVEVAFCIVNVIEFFKHFPYVSINCKKMIHLTHKVNVSVKTYIYIVDKSFHLAIYICQLLAQQWLKHIQRNQKGHCML
jgi:hypothetical protein